MAGSPGALGSPSTLATSRALRCSTGEGSSTGCASAPAAPLLLPGPTSSTSSGMDASSAWGLVKPGGTAGSA